MRYALKPCHETGFRIKSITCLIAGLPNFSFICFRQSVACQPVGLGCCKFVAFFRRYFCCQPIEFWFSRNIGTYLHMMWKFLHVANFFHSVLEVFKKAGYNFSNVKNSIAGFATQSGNRRMHHDLTQRSRVRKSFN